MHPKAISPSLVERMVRRRGTAHIHLPLDPRRTALIVVDMQNAFLDPGTDAIHVPNAVSIVPNVNRLAGAMRRAGGKVFWLQHSVSDESRGSWSNFFAMGHLTPEDSEKRNAAFAPGSCRTPSPWATTVPTATARRTKGPTSAAGTSGSSTRASPLTRSPTAA